MMTGVSSSCKLFPDLSSMHAPIRSTGDDVGKNTKGNNKKTTTVRECCMSVDMEEMEKMGNV